MRTRPVVGLAVTVLVLAGCATDGAEEPDAPADESEGVDDTDDQTTDDLGDDGDEVDGEGDDAVAGDGTDDTDGDGSDGGTDDGTDGDTAVGEGEQLTVGSSDVGDHLVDASGMTVYIHAMDELEDGQPSCVGDCAAVWEPVPAADDEPEVGDDVDEDLVGTVEREDAEVVGAERQLTYDDRPLYTFASDTEPGEARGQELGGIWFVVAADGEPIGEVPDEEELEELDVDEEEAEG